MKVHELKPYDAGLLAEYGGGNVEWWQDYIRAELARAHEYYQSQFIAGYSDGKRMLAQDALKSCVKALELAWNILSVNGFRTAALITSDALEKAKKAGE